MHLAIPVLVIFLGVVNSADILACLYTIDIQNGLYFDLKTLVLEYAHHFNYSISMRSIDQLKNFSEIDFVLIDFNHFRDKENPFILPAVVPFYSVILAIPSITKLERDKFYLLPFIGEALFVHIFTPVLFAVILKLISWKTKFLENLVKTIKIFLTCAVTRKEFQVFYIPLIFYNMIITLMYNSYLGSFFTQSVDKTDYQFICSDTRRELLNMKDSGIDFMIMQPSDYFAHILSLNVSYGYCMTSIFWYQHFGDYNNLIFRKVYTRDSAYGHFLRVNKYSVHLKDFNDYLLTVYSTGLMAKWGSSMRIKNYSLMIHKFVKVHNGIMKFKDLRVPLMVFGFMLGLACLSFVIEVGIKVFG